jgi:hypothetical protein
MADNIKVEVRGLRELRTAFKQLDDNLPKKLAAEFKTLASKIVGAVQEKVPVVSGAARGSYKPRSTATGASIAFSGTAAPYAPWLDFGGAVGRKKSIKRAFIKEGRYLYPTIREMNSDILDATDEAVKKVAKEAGFETKGGE